MIAPEIYGLAGVVIGAILQQGFTIITEKRRWDREVADKRRLILAEVLARSTEIALNRSLDISEREEITRKLIATSCELELICSSGFRNDLMDFVHSVSYVAVSDAFDGDGRPTEIGNLHDRFIDKARKEVASS